MSDISRRPLGELERRVMDVLWAHAPLAVRDVGDALRPRELAYNTVMTTLDRLFKKGLLARSKDGQAFHYWPRLAREEYERMLVAAVLEDLPAVAREAVVSGFLDFAAADERTLAELERLLAERKRGEP